MSDFVVVIIDKCKIIFFQIPYMVKNTFFILGIKYDFGNGFS